MENKHYVKSIRTWANVGLIGSLVVVVVAILFKYLSPFEMRQTDPVYRSLTMACSLFAILDMAVILYSMRKTKRKLLEISDLEKKLHGYASMTKTNSLSTMVSTILVSAIIILTSNYTLLMLAMMLVLLLFFTYPNMYRIKVELNIDDDQMKQLFGDQYVADTQEAIEINPTTSTDEHDPKRNEHE